MSEDRRCCNACGRKQNISESGLGEEFLKIQKTWGYFSEKDGETHRFFLCEACYDRIRKQFQLPVEILENEP